MPAEIPLRLSALTEMPFEVRRSGFRWSIADGQAFRKGELLGYCNLGLVGEPAGQGDLFGGSGDALDLQVALVAKTSGSLHHVHSLHGGGWSDRQPWYRWGPEADLAMVRPAHDDANVHGDGLLDYHFIAGRRATGLAEDRSGLATGWHDRLRAWRFGAAASIGTVVGLGSCELYDTLRGEQGAFVDLLNGAPGAAHIVDVPERPIIHSARMLVEQAQRSDADRAEIEDVFRSAIAACPPGVGGQDWSFVLFALQGLLKCPVRDRYDVLTPGGVETSGPANALILSIGSEQTMRLRHRRLGFMLDCRQLLYRALDDATKEWLKRNFEFVSHPVDAVKRDYLEMARVLRAENPTLRIMVLNAVSTRGSEDITDYSAYDDPMSLRLDSVRARELNSMLHDIEREADIAIVDSDAIAAQLGSSIAVPDGVHQNGEMQSMVRQEIQAILRTWQVPGFG